MSFSIFLAGDSTVADYPETSAPQAGWGQTFPAFLDPSISVRNHAANGRSSKSFIDEGRLDAIRDLDFFFHWKRVLDVQESLLDEGTKGRGGHHIQDCVGPRQISDGCHEGMGTVEESHLQVPLFLHSAPLHIEAGFVEGEDFLESFIPFDGE